MPTLYNSSLYRVVPLVEAIKGDIGRLNKFLSLVNVSIDSLPQCYYYGDNEKLLKPTKAHLMGIIGHIQNRENVGLPPPKNADRALLYAGDTRQRREAADRARALLEQNYESLGPGSRDWYVFEGYTHPDIFIEGSDYVIVCEGKWTEAGITAETANLSGKRGEYRSQMARHIQAALNYTNKRVCAFYIVDAECGYTADLTPDRFCAQLDAETVAIDGAQKQRMRDAFKGYTTWQDVSKALPDIVFLSKREIDARRERQQRL